MPKKRETPAVTPIRNEPTPEQVEKFASQADGGEPEEKTLDPNAKRDFKEIRLPLNEYEFRELERKAKETNRSRSNFIRQAILEYGSE